MPEEQPKSPFCTIGWCAWEKEYYGYRCSVCGDFVPFGSEPWIERDDED